MPIAGDLYVLDNTSGKIQQLTKTSDVESNPHSCRTASAFGLCAAAMST
ncbi:MAG: hypothetical protein WDO73_30495 [Ignavibacteriota bacterium]